MRVHCFIKLPKIRVGDGIIVSNLFTNQMRLGRRFSKVVKHISVYLRCTWCMQKNCYQIPKATIIVFFFFNYTDPSSPYVDNTSKLFCIINLFLTDAKFGCVEGFLMIF